MRPFRRLALAYARLRYGTAPEPLNRWAEHGGVFWAWSIEETVVEATWRALPKRVRMLAVLGAASVIDCPWCLDYGSHVAGRGGLSEAELRELHRWRDSELFSDDDRLVLTYAERMCSTPVQVDAALVDRLRSRFGERGLVELTALVALENQRSRFNASMGVLPQGWSRVCALPASAAVTTSGSQPQWAPPASA